MAYGCCRYWTVISSILLLGAGITALVFAIVYRDQVDKSFNQICDKADNSLSSCHGTVCSKTEKNSSPLKCNLKNSCKRNIMITLGFTCAAEQDWKKGCSTTSSELPRVMSWGLKNFEIAMIVVGCVAAGWALLVFIVAMGACCSGQGVAFYGFLCFLGFIAFSFVGCAFLVLGAVPHSSMKGISGMSLFKNCEATYPSASTCIQAATCNTARDFRNETDNIGFGIGIPLIVGAVLQLFGIFACCFFQHWDDKGLAAPAKQYAYQEAYYPPSPQQFQPPQRYDQPPPPQESMIEMSGTSGAHMVPSYEAPQPTMVPTYSVGYEPVHYQDFYQPAYKSAFYQPHYQAYEAPLARPQYFMQEQDYPYGVPGNHY